MKGRGSIRKGGLKIVILQILFTLAVINRSILSSLFTLIFKYNFVKILSLIISISISLKTSNIIENKSQAFKSSDFTITVHNDLYYNELKNLNKTQQRYHIKSTNFK